MSHSQVYKCYDFNVVVLLANTFIYRTRTPNSDGPLAQPGRALGSYYQKAILMPSAEVTEWSGVQSPQGPYFTMTEQEKNGFINLVANQVIIATVGGASGFYKGYSYAQNTPADLALLYGPIAAGFMLDGIYFANLKMSKNIQGNIGYGFIGGIVGVAVSATSTAAGAIIGYGVGTIADLL